MNISKDTISTAVRRGRLGRLVVIITGGFVLSFASAAEKWPPVEPLEPQSSVTEAAPLPGSITAEALGQGRWRCTFRFHPPVEAGQVALSGSFNGWDRHALKMDGPDAGGNWSASIDLETGVYQYKFLVDGATWFTDPVNLGRVPDGFGEFNSLVRLGRLAQMRYSDAQVGDGQVDQLGLEHRPPLPLYIQPTDDGDVSIRYRTLAHDVRAVQVAVRGGQTMSMRLVSQGPLFAYYEATVPVPTRSGAHSPKVRTLAYTFILDDGDGAVGDPYTYRHSFTDESRFETPEWARHAIWYQILPDRFRNGSAGNDPESLRPWTSDWFATSPWEGGDGQSFYEFFVFERFYGGDLAGLESQLPYLKELGVNALYLNPVFSAPSNHKYDARSLIHVDDGFGVGAGYFGIAEQEDLLDPSTWRWTPSDEQFLAFLGIAHQQGFKVVIDGVFNHVGVEHPAFVDVRDNGRQSRYAEWFDVTSWEPFEYKTWSGFDYMPVFKKNRYGYATDAVKQHIFAITRRWMDPNGDGDPSDGVDGWRLDVAGDIPRPFWVEWRKLVKEINPNALITAEEWHRADRVLDGQQFDGVMNYEFAKTVARWIFNHEQKIATSHAVAQLAELRLAYPDEASYVLLNLLDSHDTDRAASMAQNPDREYDRENRVQDHNLRYDNGKPAPEAYARARLAALLQMTYVGAPLIYYGDEVGMWGADDPTCRKPMLWKDLQPYEKPEENSVMEEHLDFYKRLCALRRGHAALRVGTFRTLLADDAQDVWVFERVSGDEHVLVALNASGLSRQVEIPLPAGAPRQWHCVFGELGDVGANAQGDVPLTVPAIGGVVLTGD